MKLAVKGGIGDFLQFLPFMLVHPEYWYVVASHHDRVQQFFDAVGVDVEELSLGLVNGATNCPRTLFLDGNPFPQRQGLFDGERPVIGIHLGGSSYSISVEKRFGFPTKQLPFTVLNELRHALPQCDIVLFGAPSELAGVKVWETASFKLADDDDVTVNLSRVTECCAFIGSDSAFKTMAAMLRIPTVVWMGDYIDIHRDEKFIDPYVEAGVMSVFRYKDLTSDEEVRAGVKFSLEKLSMVL